MGRITHMAMCTKNHRRLARFYRIVFGWDEVWNPLQNSPHAYYIGDGYFKGRRLGITRFGTVTDSMTRLLVGKLGLDPDKDVSYIQVGDVPILLASLTTGKTIDGAIIQPPYYLKAVASGMRVLVNMQEMDIPVQQTGLNTTDKFISKILTSCAAS